MARKKEFYKGRRKRRNRILIPAAIVLGLLSLTVVLFYSMQKYVVITKENVAISLPLLQQDGVALPEEQSEPTALETTTVSIVFEQADYTDVESVVPANVEPIRAIFVSADELKTERIQEYADRLSVGNALVLEMKPESGALKWDSSSWAAINFGLSGNPLPDDLKQLLSELQSKGVHLAAQISVCRDELYASRSTVVALRAESGFNYSDDKGTWLDPYSLDVRQYTVELVRELWAMGFDEVILAHVEHPTLPENTTVVYTRDMSTPPSPVNAVCGFAVSVSDELREREGQLSIYLNSPSALVRTDSDNGQSGPLFFKLFDRVYYETDKYTYTFNIDDVRGSVTRGKAEYRFVPVVYNYLPNDSSEVSWVLIDTEN